jgi:hypothetical protein
MASLTAAELVTMLTQLPAPSTAPPQIPSGTVSVFQDDNWGSARLDLSTVDFVPDERQTIQSSMFDSATWVAFNLPVGTVMTLMDNVQPVDPSKGAADLSGCGQCVDLVGTGQTEAVDLGSVNMNDSVSSFFWRTVDLTLGAIELFGDAGFAGGRSTIFLSEWNSGTVYDLSQWWLQDALSSVRWSTLTDRQTAILFDNSNGTGNQFNNIKGWGSTKEVSNLEDLGFNDTASSFSWTAVVPMKEIIAPFNILSSTTSGSSELTSVVNGTNNSSLSQPVTVSLQNTNAQTVTVATQDQTVTGISSTLTITEQEGLKDVASETVACAVTVSFSYTQSTTKTTSQTQTIALSISQTVNAPAYTTYTATLLVNIGQIPPTFYQTSAQRWYNVPVTGGVVDPANNGWYMRVEPVKIYMAGSLASNSTVSINTTPIQN